MVAREIYLKGDRYRETQSTIAKYFSGEYHEKYGNERAIPAQPHAYSSVALNVRKLDRLPMALLEARDFNGLRNTLGDLKFVQAKCIAGMGHELLAEATKAVMSCSVYEQADPEVKWKALIPINYAKLVLTKGNEQSRSRLVHKF